MKFNMRNIFYRVIKIILTPIFFLIYRPVITGKENIPNTGSLVLAGNHTNWKDPLLLISAQSRQVHFLAKIELFSGIIGIVVKGIGCVPVNRKIHDKGALNSAKEVLKNGEVIGIFPEGTINRTNDIVMPFKIGAVKMAKDTDSTIVPFVITGKYNVLGKRIKIEFLKGRKVSKDLDIENRTLMKDISNKLEEYNECNKFVKTKNDKNTLEEVLPKRRDED